jgi:hypothetical protein
MRKEYDELKTDLVEELNAVETRMTQPAGQAKESLAPMKKTIKRRNEKKVTNDVWQLACSAVANIPICRPTLKSPKGVLIASKKSQSAASATMRVWRKPRQNLPIRRRLVCSEHHFFNDGI